MRALTYDDIHPLWTAKAAMDLDDAPVLVEALGAAQPDILSYLLGTGEDILTPEERQILFFLGILIWYVIDTISDAIPQITVKQLWENEEKNLRMLEYLDGEPEGEFMNTVTRIMDTYNQSTLLKYVIERIMEEPEKNSDIIEDHIGMMVIYLKSLIDSIDAAVP